MLSTDYNVTLPRNIIRIISSRGMKRCAVAEKAGFSKHQFSAMLNGRRIIKPCDAIAIAEALGVEMNDLYGTRKAVETEDQAGGR